MQTMIEKLGTFVHELSIDRLPRSVVDTTKNVILHHLHTGFCGVEEMESQIALSLLRENYGKGGRCTVLGQKGKFPVIGATFANAVLMHSIQQEDTYGGLHPGPHTIPAAMSLAEEENRTGKQILESLAAGYEVNLYLGDLCARYTSPRGWRGTTIFGVLGAAATSAKVLELDLNQTMDALANASNMASGLMECWTTGTPEWLFTSGLAAQNGVISATIAKKGGSGAKSSFEGSKGFFKAYCGTTPDNTESLMAGLGSKFLMPGVNLKPYTVITTILPVIHNVVRLATTDDIAPERVQSIVVIGGPRITKGPLASSILDPGPYVSRTQAFKSLPCAIGIALKFREVSIHTIPQFQDPLVARIAAKVSVETNDSAAEYFNKVEIATTDGKKHTIEGEEFPSLTPEEVRRNLLRSASKYVPRNKVEKLIKVVDQLEQTTAEDISTCLS